MPSRIASLVTPRDVAPPLLPVNAMHGGEYGSLGIWRARSEHAVTAPRGSAAAASSSPPPAPARPGRGTPRGAVGPLGPGVAGPAARAPASPRAAAPGAAA